MGNSFSPASPRLRDGREHPHGGAHFERLCEPRGKIAVERDPATDRVEQFSAGKHSARRRDMTHAFRKVFSRDGAGLFKQLPLARRFRRRLRRVIMRIDPLDGKPSLPRDPASRAHPFGTEPVAVHARIDGEMRAVHAAELRRRPQRHAQTRQRRDGRDQSVRSDPERVFFAERGRQHEDILRNARDAQRRPFVGGRYRKRGRDPAQRAGDFLRAVSVSVVFHHGDQGLTRRNLKPQIFPLSMIIYLSKLRMVWEAY